VYYLAELYSELLLPIMPIAVQIRCPMDLYYFAHCFLSIRPGLESPTEIAVVDGPADVALCFDESPCDFIVDCATFLQLSPLNYSCFSFFLFFISI